MVRITFSALASLATLLVLATVSAAQDLYRFYNDDLWAKSYPPSRGPPPHYVGVTFDDGFASIYERWEFSQAQGGSKFVIKSHGNGLFLTAYDGEAYASQFDETLSKWNVVPNGSGKIKILTDDGLAVTARRRQPDHPISLFLDPADGTNAQLFSFEKI
ncbi:hypothetical protein BGZ94_006085 [Podila epigama]|nr:hypothetical protein BGZ94_006085 [Podila epigama]